MADAWDWTKRIGAAVGSMGTSELMADTGKNTARASNFGDTPNYDESRFEQATGEGTAGTPIEAQPGEPGAVYVPGVNGMPGKWYKRGAPVYSSADKNINYYRNQATDAQKRAGVQMDMAQQQQARAQQMQALGLMEGAAMGSAPSRAELLARRGADDAAMNQIAMAGMAGAGPAGALAARGAMGNAADIQRRSYLDSAALRADEMARARDSYFMGASGLRQGDYGQAMGQAQLEAEQRRLNDQYAMGMQQLGWGAVDLNARQNIAQQQLLAGSHGQADQMNMGANQANAMNEWTGIKMGLGAGMGAMSMATGKPMG